MVVNDEPNTASTDMGKFCFTTPLRSTDHAGNVSYEVPSFHGSFPIPTEPGVSIHHPDFAGHAGTDAAHMSAMKCAKGLSMLALRVLTSPKLVEEAKKDFQNLPI